MSWIAIFKPGKHTDSAGKTMFWTEDDVKNIAHQYNNQSEENKHDAPLVKGHPKTDDPAVGWVDKLKYEGGKLWAKLKDIKDDVVNEIRQGAYKKVSVSLYSDKKLRHVGLLGATPPAVKGLGDVTLSDTENSYTYDISDCFDFQEAEVSSDAKTNTNFNQNEINDLIKTEITKQIENKYSDFVKTNKDKQMNEKYLKFRDAFIDKLKEQTSDEIAARAAAIFSDDETAKKVYLVLSDIAPDYFQLEKTEDETKKEEKQDTYEHSEAYKKQQMEIQELREQNRKHEFSEYLNTTNLVGVQKTKAIPVLEIAYRKDNKVMIPFTYAEGDKSSLDIVKDFINTIPKQIELGEVADTSSFAETFKSEDAEIERFNKENL